jgi:thiol-disulfide isomerase/thioredoxin
MKPLCARQVHLDFHTSEHIPGIGARFRRRQFQQALQAGHVNSITLFAKCHHGWSYYPTKVGNPHPHLQRNLLQAQLQACHEIGVRAPIYLTLGWSAYDAAQHPDWIVRQRDGTPGVMSVDPNAKPTDRRPDFSWTFLCPGTPYRDLVLAQTAEICRDFDVDGLFYDICAWPACWCPSCRAGMQAAGLNPELESDAQRYKILTWQRIMADIQQILRQHHPAATLFFNGTANLYGTEYHQWDTHFELEDLPTTWGGYNKFPIRAKLYAQQAKPFLAMSGKFHTAWGEFGGFKHPDALRYEAAAMIAWGARCSIGDQLHPSGEMDPETYRNIGQAYAYAKQLEPYGLDGQPAASLGLWLCGQEPHDQGTANILLEKQIDFAIVDPAGDLSRYDTIILTGAPCLTPADAARLNAYVKNGGGLIVVGESALDAERGRVLVDIGAQWVGPAQFENDYLVAKPELADGLVSTPFLNYTAAIRTKPARGTRVLATIREPFFNRTYAQYCSHQNTPNQLRDAPHPGITQKGRVLFMAHALGAMYYAHGARLHRDLFLRCLARIHQHPIVATTMPSCGRINLVHQPAKQRYVAHLLYAPPLQRGRCLVIEDLVPLLDVPVRLSVPEKIKKAYLAPSRKALTLRRQAPGVAIVIPKLVCHQAVVFEY